MTQIGEGVLPPAPPPSGPPHVGGHLVVTSRTVVTAPADRTRKDIGVGEMVKLQITNATGGIDWSITGSSTLSATSGLSVNLTAHWEKESITVTATDKGCGCTIDIKFEVIEPAGVVMSRTGGIWHAHNIPSVGIRTDIYISPDTVSFENIEISEDDCAGIVTGYFTGTPLDGVQHAGHGAGTWVGVGSCVAGKGSTVGGQDTAQSGYCNFGVPYANGTFDWPIPWLYRVSGDANEKGFTVVHQQFTIDASGDMSVSKAGANGAAAFADANSTY